MFTSHSALSRTPPTLAKAKARFNGSLIEIYGNIRFIIPNRSSNLLLDHMRSDLLGATNNSHRHAPLKLKCTEHVRYVSASHFDNSLHIQ